MMPVMTAGGQIMLKPFARSLLAHRLAVPYALIRLCQTVRCAMVAPCGGSIIPNPLTLVPAA